MSASSCNICGSKHDYTDNPIFFCKDCGIKVHKKCYGIYINNNSGLWVCQKCNEKCKSQSCQLCCNLEGPMKPTQKQGWAHVLCALYLPEAYFLQIDYLEKINFPDLTKQKCEPCSICIMKGRKHESIKGATLKCKYSDCKSFFHVTCALKSKLLYSEDIVKYVNNNRDNSLSPNVAALEDVGSSSNHKDKKYVYTAYICFCEIHISQKDAKDSTFNYLFKSPPNYNSLLTKIPQSKLETNSTNSHTIHQFEKLRKRQKEIQRIFASVMLKTINNSTKDKGKDLSSTNNLSLANVKLPSTSNITSGTYKIPKRKARSPSPNATVENVSGGVKKISSGDADKKKHKSDNEIKPHSVKNPLKTQLSLNINNNNNFNANESTDKSQHKREHAISVDRSLDEIKIAKTSSETKRINSTTNFLKILNKEITASKNDISCQKDKLEVEKIIDNKPKMKDIFHQKGDNTVIKKDKNTTTFLDTLSVKQPIDHDILKSDEKSILKQDKNNETIAHAVKKEAIIDSPLDTKTDPISNDGKTKANEKIMEPTSLKGYTGPEQVISSYFAKYIKFTNGPIADSTLSSKSSNDIKPDSQEKSTKTTESNSKSDVIVPKSNETDQNIKVADKFDNVETELISDKEIKTESASMCANFSKDSPPLNLVEKSNTLYISSLLETSETSNIQGKESQNITIDSKIDSSSNDNSIITPVSTADTRQTNNLAKFKNFDKTSLDPDFVDDTKPNDNFLTPIAPMSLQNKIETGIPDSTNNFKESSLDSNMIDNKTIDSLTTLVSTLDNTIKTIPETSNNDLDAKSLNYSIEKQTNNVIALDNETSGILEKSNSNFKETVSFDSNRLDSSTLSDNYTSSTTITVKSTTITVESNADDSSNTEHFPAKHQKRMTIRYLSKEDDSLSSLFDAVNHKRANTKESIKSPIIETIPKTGNIEKTTMTTVVETTVVNSDEIINIQATKSLEVTKGPFLSDIRYNSSDLDKTLIHKPSISTASLSSISNEKSLNITPNTIGRNENKPVTNKEDGALTNKILSDKHTSLSTPISVDGLISNTSQKSTGVSDTGSTTTLLLLRKANESDVVNSSVVNTSDQSYNTDTFKSFDSNRITNSSNNDINDNNQYGTTEKTITDFSGGGYGMNPVAINAFYSNMAAMADMLNNNQGLGGGMHSLNQNMNINANALMDPSTLFNAYVGGAGGSVPYWTATALYNSMIMANMANTSAFMGLPSEDSTAGLIDLPLLQHPYHMNNNINNNINVNITSPSNFPSSLDNSSVSATTLVCKPSSFVKNENFNINLNSNNFINNLMDPNPVHMQQTHPAMAAAAAHFAALMLQQQQNQSLQFQQGSNLIPDFDLTNMAHNFGATTSHLYKSNHNINHVEKGNINDFAKSVNSPHNTTGSQSKSGRRSNTLKNASNQKLMDQFYGTSPHNTQNVKSHQTSKEIIDAHIEDSIDAACLLYGGTSSSEKEKPSLHELKTSNTMVTHSHAKTTDATILVVTEPTSGNILSTIEANSSILKVSIPALPSMVDTTSTETPIQSPIKKTILGVTGNKNQFEMPELTNNNYALKGCQQNMIGKLSHHGLKAYSFDNNDETPPPAVKQNAGSKEKKRHTSLNASIAKHSNLSLNLSNTEQRRDLSSDLNEEPHTGNGMALVESDTSTVSLDDHPPATISISANSTNSTEKLVVSATKTAARVVKCCSPKTIISPVLSINGANTNSMSVGNTSKVTNNEGNSASHEWNLHNISQQILASFKGESAPISMNGNEQLNALDLFGYKNIFSTTSDIMSSNVGSIVSNALLMAGLGTNNSFNWNKKLVNATNSFSTSNGTETWENVIQAHVEAFLKTPPGEKASFDLTTFLQSLSAQVEENKLNEAKLANLRQRASQLALENATLIEKLKQILVSCNAFTNISPLHASSLPVTIGAGVGQNTPINFLASLGNSFMFLNNKNNANQMFPNFLTNLGSSMGTPNNFLYNTSTTPMTNMNKAVVANNVNQPPVVNMMGLGTPTNNYNNMLNCFAAGVGFSPLHSSVMSRTPHTSLQ